MAVHASRVFFLLNLLQDVNIVRGLVYLTARETSASIGLLVSEGFIKRDTQGAWQREIATLAADADAEMYLYRDADEVVAVLSGGCGIIFAASESNLPAHWETGDVFRSAPPNYLRVTLQHGFECVGFLQSREHVMSHGRNISFGADVVCGWFDEPSLTSLTASERSKLYVTGPPTLLYGRSPPVSQNRLTGLVCENMHSVRLRASGDHKASFMDTFFAFCTKMAECGESVTLRPHPGGRYVLKNNVSLPVNVQLDMQPLYDLDLSQFSFGISAPSTIVFDLVLAGVPVGLWRDQRGVMDAGNYDGLTEISTLDDWLAFRRDAQLRPEMILDRQAAFLGRLAMPKDPAEIYRRFARLIVAGLEGSRSVQAAPRPNGVIRRAELSRDRLVEVSA